MADKDRLQDVEDTDMTVELELDDGKVIECAIVTILTVNHQDYIALMPTTKDESISEGEVWFYRYSEDENDPNVEPELGFIDDDDEYEAVADAFDEFLDNVEFEAMKD